MTQSPHTPRAPLTDEPPLAAELEPARRRAASDAATTLGADEADDSGDPPRVTRVASESLDAFRADLAAVGSREPRIGTRPGFGPGDLVGRFVLLSAIGEGGFGTVFEAEDTELGRRVALKILRPRAEMVERLAPKFVALFRREAQTAARLNHPNIMTLFDVGTEAGSPYLVLELLEGESLADRVRHGPIAPLFALDVMAQVARGLAYAHGSGIIHRDLKPSNVFLCRDGTAKILDLGLARVVGVWEGAPSDGGADAPSGLTMMSGGGTPEYMAPEQWDLQRQDARTDVFAFGVMLFELLSGARPWASARPHERPDDEALFEKLGGLPSALKRWVLSLMASVPAARPATMDVVLTELARMRALLAPVSATPRRTRIRLIAAALTVALVALGVMLSRNGQELAPATRAPRPPPSHTQLTFHGDVTAPELSPDGRVLAYVRERKLWLHELERNEAVSVHSAERYYAPRWSVDGKQLTFSALVLGQPHRLALAWPAKTVSPTSLGGVERAFSPDGEEAVVADAPRGLIVLGRDGTQRRTFNGPPDARFVIGLDWAPRERIVALWLLGDRASLHLVDARTGASTRLLEGDTGLSSPRFGRDGESIYYLRATKGVRDVMRLRLGSDGVALGAPEQVLSGLPLGETLSLSRDGRRLVTVRVARFAHLAAGSLPPASVGDVDLSLKPLTRGTTRVRLGRFSPDGTQLAYAAGERPNAELYVMASRGGAARAVTRKAGWIESLAWSPDNRTLAVIAEDAGVRRLAFVDVASGAVRVAPYAAAPNEGRFQLDWSPRGLAYAVLGAGPPKVLEPESGAPLRGLDEAAPSGYYFAPRWSRDGRHLAAYVNHGGKQVGLRLFDLDTGTSRLLALKDVAFPIAWSVDGRSLYVGVAAPDTPTDVVRVEKRAVSDGRREATLRFPADRQVTGVELRQDGLQVVTTLEDRRSDAWLVEGFE